MNSTIDTPTINPIKLQKLLFIYNAIEDGWCVVKQGNSYVFTKNHENKKEIFLDDYLQKFVYKNISIDDL